MSHANIHRTAPRLGAALFALLAVAATAPDARAQTAQHCLRTQEQVGGAICHGIARCYAKAIKTSAPFVDPVCLAERSDRLSVKFANEEALSNCLVEPAAAATYALMQPVMEALYDDVKLNLQRCGSKKMGALGRYCKQGLRCYSSANGHSEPVDPLCLAEAQGKMQQAFVNQDLSQTCAVIGDYVTHEPVVEALVGDVNTLLVGGGTTTTSTTVTTTSISTTTTLVPGNCAEDGAMDPCIAYRDNAACTACVDAAMDQTAATLCGGAGPTCGDAFDNIACGYAINTSTGCGATCCP